MANTYTIGEKKFCVMCSDDYGDHGDMPWSFTYYPTREEARQELIRSRKEANGLGYTLYVRDCSWSSVVIMEEARIL